MYQYDTKMLQIRSLARYVVPFSAFWNLRSNCSLVRQLIAREVQKRYRGSYLGLCWALIQPLATLLVYTFVFSVVLHSHWDQGQSSPQFALTMLAGLLVYDVFAEILQLSALLITQNTGYVKKVIFPLEVLSMASLGSSLIFLGLNFIVFIVGMLAINHHLTVTTLLFPLVLVPLVMLTIGTSWFVASLGVFIPDLNHFLQIFLRLMFFITPIFYPIEKVPEALRWIIYINPLAILVEQARRTLLWNQPLQWRQWGIVTLVSLVIMQFGYAWFMETKRGFADVL